MGLKQQVSFVERSSSLIGGSTVNMDSAFLSAHRFEGVDFPSHIVHESIVLALQHLVGLVGSHGGDGRIWRKTGRKSNRAKKRLAMHRW